MYVYERTDAAPITVKYQDENGNDLYPEDTLNGKIGLPYTTQPKSINGWAVKTTPSNASGNFSDQPQEVVYVYERTDAAPITVKYQDENGNDLYPEDTLNGKIGLPYTTQPKSINGWAVKTTPSNASGNFSDQPQEVVYVYERTDAAPITVKYQDENGNDLYPEDTLNGKIGLPYTTQPKSINGWAVKTTPSNASGNFSDQPQEVVYVYERTDAAPITVKYQDENGNDLYPEDTLNGKIGLPYTTQPKSINGWAVKTTPSNASGNFSDQPQEVVYVYERTDAAPITVKYQDENGNDLYPEDTLNGKIGLPYTTQPKSINGWAVKTTPSNASGNFSDQPQEVVYVYERTDAAPITVKYQDENGNDLYPEDTLNGKIGLPYTTQPKSINGWAVKTTPSNASGNFSDQPQEVVYVYTKDKVNPKPGDNRP